MPIYTRRVAVAVCRPLALRLVSPKRTRFHRLLLLVCATVSLIMSYYGQQPAPVTAYPPPATGQAPYMAPPQGNYAPPPPPGYPGNFDVGMNPPQPAQTQSRGDKAFLEGCCAALCCCCLLDMCF